LLHASVAPPSRRLSGGRPARRAEGETPSGTAGKMPALHQSQRRRTEPAL